MEVTDTEIGVSVLGPTNNVDIELMAKEMDYSSVKMMLLIMSGLEKNPGPKRKMAFNRTTGRSVNL